MKRAAALLLIAASLFVAANAWAWQLKITGLYSNMQFCTEDVTGVEIFLVFSRSGYFAVMQCAEGTPGIPFVLPVKVTGNSIEIEPPKENDKNGMCPESKFRGTIDESGLTGTF